MPQWTIADIRFSHVSERYRVCVRRDNCDYGPIWFMSKEDVRKLMTYYNKSSYEQLLKQKFENKAKNGKDALYRLLRQL